MNTRPMKRARIMVPEIRKSGPKSQYFFGGGGSGEEIIQQYVGAKFYDSAGKEIGVVESIRYEPDTVYKQNDGYAGNAFIMTVNGREIEFRHLHDTLLKVGADILTPV